MVAFSVEQGHGIYSGLALARKIAEFLFDPLVFFPVLVLIFIYAMSWFSYQIAQGKRGVISLFSYLIISSIILFLIRTTGPVEVKYYLLYLKDNGNYATKETITTSSGGKTYTDEIMTYKGTIAPSSVETVRISGVPYIVDMLSLLDPLIVGIYRAGFYLDRWNVQTFDRAVCFNPESIFNRALTYPFKAMLDEVTSNGMSSCLATYIEETGSALKEVKDGKDLWNKISDKNPNSFWDKVTSSALVTCGSTLLTFNIDDWYWFVVSKGMEESLSECESKFASKGYDKEKMKKAVEEYVVKYGKNSVDNLLKTVYPSVSNLTKRIESAGMGGPGATGIPDMVQDVVLKIASFMNRNFSFHFATKFKLLHETQGTVLSVIIGFAPLIFLLSLIPVGDSMINTKLLFGYFLAYFLVYLWVPILFIIYLVVWGIATMGVLM